MSGIAIGERIEASVSGAATLVYTAFRNAGRSRALLTTLEFENNSTTTHSIIAVYIVSGATTTYLFRQKRVPRIWTKTIYPTAAPQNIIGGGHNHWKGLIPLKVGDKVYVSLLAGSAIEVLGSVTEVSV